MLSILHYRILQYIYKKVKNSLHSKSKVFFNKKSHLDLKILLIVKNIYSHNLNPKILIYL